MERTTVGEMARQLAERKPTFDGDPTTIAHVMESLVWFLDAYDVLAADMAARVDRPYVVRTQMQDDVRALAQWFEDHPHAARYAFDAIKAAR
jgi:hypothetical protein